MMAMPIMVVGSVKSVNTRKSGRGQVRERTIVYEGSSGPRELLEAIVIQAQAAIKGLEGPKPAEQDIDEMTEEQKRMRIDSADEKGKGKEPPKDNVLVVFELDDDTDGAEDLLLDNLHLRLDVGENRGLDEVAFVSVTLTAEVDSRALLPAVINVTHDALCREDSESRYVSHILTWHM